MKRLIAFSLGIAVATIAAADTFNLFQPATGVLVGNSATYVTTAAANSNIISLWSGTCSSTTYLRGDGSCATPAGSGGGTVNSVSLTAPASLLSVTGSPVTSTGTLALAFATGQTATELFGTDGSGNVGLFALTGAYVPPINLASTANGGITNTLGVAHGGTGDTTLTAHGVLVGEGTSAVTALTAMALDTLLQGQGTSADPAAVSVPNCGSGTTALSYSTSTHTFGCQTISAGTGTVTSVGLSAPSVFSVGSTPVTTSGTLALTFATGQTANMALMTPNGTTGALTLRNMVGADIPAIDLSCSGNGCVTNNLPVSRLNSGSGASSTTCWYGDGTWKTCGTGGGAVSSVGLSAPSVFSVSGSPVTSSGTLALTFAPGLTANQFLATPNGLTGAVILRSIVAADLPGSITSNTSGNAATATALATTPSQCSLGSYATGIATSGNANCSALAYPTAANPSATIGLTAVNGSTGHFMDAGSAPALSQAITPTWTGAHTWSASGTFNAGLFVNGSARQLLNVVQSALTFGNTTDNQTYSFLGTGTTSFGGTISAANFNGFASPSATFGVNLTGANGSAITAIRSDAVLKLDQSINPTWSGTHVFSNAITVNGAGSSLKGGVTVATAASGATLTANAVSGTNVGLLIAGTGSTAPSVTNGLLFATSSTSTSSWRLNQPGIVSWDFINTATTGVLSITPSSGTTGLQISPAGNVTVNTSSGSAFTATGVANSYIASLTAPNTSGQSLGLRVQAGTTSADAVLNLVNAAGTLNYGVIRGDGSFFLGYNGSVSTLNGAADGGVTVGSATGGSQGAGTINATGVFVNGVSISNSSGSFTATLTGVSGTVTGTINYVISGGLVTLFNNTGSNITGTSNTTGLGLTGLPSAVQPSGVRISQNCGFSINTSLATVSMGSITSGGITLYPQGAPSTTANILTQGNGYGFTASGTKGIPAGWTCSYPL